MSLGQTLLALAAISLFMYAAVNVNRTHVAAVSETVAKQQASNAINYAQSVSELLYAQGQFYAQLDTRFGSHNDVTSTTGRLSTVTPLGDSLFATVTLQPEEPLIHGPAGRVATVRVFSPETTFVYYRGSSTLDFAGSTTFRGGVYAQTANVRIVGSGGIQGNIITGGSSVEVFGNAEANSRVLFAPNAHVQLTGSVRIRGAVVANRFTATGNTRVFFATEFDDAFPEMRGGGSKTKFVRSWR